MSDDPTITLKIDPSYHDRAPENAQEDLVWPVMDTVWNLLRETAAKVALLDIREALAVENPEIEVPDEKVLFAHLDKTCPCGRDTHGWLDVSPDNEMLAAAFGNLNDALVHYVRQFMASAITVTDENPED